MKIKADVELKYNEESIGSYEGLYAVIKFKEDGRFFKTKLKPYLIVKDYDTSREEYINELTRLSNNKNEVKDMIKDTIRNYFYKKHREDKIGSALDRLGDMKKFTLEVDIDFDK